MTEDNPRQHSRTKAVLVIGLMFAIFIVPYAYVLYIYKTGDIPTAKTTEKGVFFQPFIPMSAHSYTHLDEQKAWLPDSLENKWAILSLAGKQCEQNCLEKIFNAQQGIAALTRYKDRVDQIVLIHPEFQLNEGLQTIVHLKHYVHPVINASLFERVEQQIPDSNGASGYTIIVDPNSQLLLWYTPEQAIQEVLRDIKRLLKSSEAGYNDQEVPDKDYE